MSEREQKMEALLLDLDRRGGLGLDMHARILEALGTPNGKFCTRARDCLKAGCCTRDPVCTE